MQAQCGIVITHGNLDDLVSTLRGRSEEIVWLVGAAVSSLSPTSIPSAQPVVRSCLEMLLSRLEQSDNRGVFSDASQLLSAQDSATGRLRVPLETLLENLDAHNSMGVNIAKALVRCGGGPNELHRVLAEELSAGRFVLTTNFDESVEKLAALDRDRCWLGQGVIGAGARLLKLHGTYSQSDTLRHTLRRVDARFPAGARAKIRAVTTKPVVVLGYEGADYDVLDLIAPTGDRVEWVQLPGRDTPAGARVLGASRDIRVIEADLVDVVGALTGEAARYDGNDTARFEDAVEQTVYSIPEEAVVGVLVTLIFEASVSFRECADLTENLLSYLRGSSYRRSYLSLLAAKVRHRGRLGDMARSALLYMRLAQTASTTTERWRHISDAADSLDGWFYGQGPLWRRISYWPHRAAARRSPQDGWLWFRTARSARARGDWALVARMLERSMACDLNTWERGHCHRMRALALAAQQRPFDSELERAQALFDFGSRTQASADVLRTAAACELLSGNVERAQELLVDAIQEHRRNKQRPGLIQSALVLAATELSPRLAEQLILL